MRVFVILAISSVFGISLFLFETDHVYGLSCMPEDVVRSFEDADVVFSGNVVSKEYQESHDDFTFVGVTLFSITESFKGVYQDTIMIHSDEKFWGANFTKGSEYVVFAQHDQDNTWQQLCTPTSLVEHADMDLIRTVSGDYILSPLQQTQMGIHRSDVVCKYGLELTIKANTLSPACVTSETKAKLFERGWTVDATINGESSRGCYAEPEPGLCKAAIEKYYFDWETNSCKPFVWGGCGGTVPFDSMELCQGLCTGMN